MVSYSGLGSGICKLQSDPLYSTIEFREVMPCVRTRTERLFCPFMLSGSHLRLKFIDPVTHLIPTPLDLSILIQFPS